MLVPRPLRLVGLSIPLVLILVVCVHTESMASDVLEDSVCVEGALPGNPDNPLRLCSIVASNLEAKIVPEGLQLSWDAPPRSESSYVGPLVADSLWGVPEGDPPPGISISGTYLGVQDRRIQIAVVQIADTLNSGTIGVERVRIIWSSLFESTDEGFLGGILEVTPENIGQPMQFGIQNVSGAVDTSVVPGVRITFQSGTLVEREWTAAFDVEDFTGYHVWRWRSDAAVQPANWGRYNKAKNTRSPTSAWPQATPRGRRFTYVDRDVFDGTVYHYAVTVYDEGFRRNTGTTLGMVFDSPVPLAMPGGDLSPVQLRVEFLRPPKEQFVPVTAVPNPFRQAECDLGDFEGTCTVRFINAPVRGRLLIYTVAGDLVREIAHNDPNSGTIIWNLENGGGSAVASGVYIYKIIDLLSGQESFGRLAVIR